MGDAWSMPVITWAFVRDLVDVQAADEQLWSLDPVPPAEAYLRHELRRLHDAIVRAGGAMGDLTVAVGAASTAGATAITAVRRLHSTRYFAGDGCGRAVCAECGQAWPCATTEAINAAFGPERPPAAPDRVEWTDYA